ncbi:3911_t:CDS:2, partial [Ambispora gerdemannii]
MHIPTPINGQSDKDNSTNSMNLEQAQNDTPEKFTQSAISPKISQNTTSILTHDQKTIQLESQTFIESGQMPIDQKQNIISSEIAELARPKIFYNQKVEQGIMHELSLYTKEISSIQEIDMQIPELSLEKILTGSDEVMAQIIANTINCQEVISIPKKNAHVVELTSSNDISNTKSTAQNSASLKLPEAEVSIPTSNHLVTASDNKSRPPILILPEDSKEKQNQVLLYKKKDITAIQKKLGINSNINKMAVSESKIAKELADLYKLLLELVRDLMPIQGKLGIDINPILEAELRRDEISSDKPIRLFDLLLCLEDDIMTIQKELGIVGYTNQEMAEETDKNTKVYFRKFEEFHDLLEDDLGVLIKKFADIGVKKFWFTGEGLPLFPNVSPQQLHEIFIKKSASNNQIGRFLTPSVLCIAFISELDVEELSELLSEVIESEASESEDVEIFNLWDSESFDLPG